MRKLLLITYLVQGLAGLTGTQKAATPTADRNADIYAIYSLMIPAGQTTATMKDPIWLIAGVTTGHLPGPGPSDPDSFVQKCIRAPQGSEEVWKELMADYNAHKSDSMTLERSFTLPKQYEILSADELKEVQMTMRGPVIPLNPRFQGAQYLIYLSNVYFNRDHTLAIASVGVNLGGRWMIFQKSRDQWTEAPGWGGCRGSA